ncbi:DUF2061 domain-containing protein [Membranihabitans marinus]|uniref:DUF2061 domain-containing protein n=1 Tax=Membranihabitans marinus TaxID=1227546 RepID=UPI001F1EBB0C|nr:DUF2061 domain-containing protein [Membranihabitans marinus]
MAEVEKVAKVKESHARSFIKGVTWRIVGTLDTMLISYFVTGNWTFAFSIASIEVITKLLLYYFHERAWQLLPRGSVRTWFKK